MAKITVKRGNKIIKVYDDQKPQQVRMSKRDKYIASLPSLADGVIVHSNKFNRKLIDVPNVETNTRTEVKQETPVKRNENKVEAPRKNRVIRVNLDGTITDLSEPKEEIVDTVDDKVEPTVVTDDPVIETVSNNYNNQKSLAELLGIEQDTTSDDNTPTVYIDGKAINSEIIKDEPVVEQPSKPDKKEEKEEEYDYSNIPVGGQPMRKKRNNNKRSDY